MNMSVSNNDLSPSERSQDRTGEVIGASVPLLILPTLAVALRLLSRRISKARFWVSCLTYTRNGEAKAYREDSGTIILSYWPVYVSSRPHLGDNSYSQTCSSSAGVQPSTSSSVRRLQPLFDSQTSLTHLVVLHYGFGRHFDTLPEQTPRNFFKLLYAFEFNYALAMTSVKFSMYAPLQLLTKWLNATCSVKNDYV